MKSKITRSLWAPYFEEFELLACGVRGYWKIPDFRGEMIDGKWCSPHTEMFEAQNWKVFDSEIMMLAVMDYLTPLRNLDVSGYRALTFEETIRGIPGSYIGPVNMKTSAGPPLKGGKRNYLSVEPEIIEVDPEFQAIWDSLGVRLDENVITSVMAICSMKDEPLKHTKRFTRIFNNMPAAFNLKLKQHMAPVKSFMRANWRAFECVVGINMTSLDCNDILQHLRTIDPTLTHLVDGDAKKLDKAWNGDLFDFVAYVFYALAFAINCDAGQTYTLLHSIKHTMYSSKNDLFEIFHNPSGNDITVELNSICISLGERYVYYRNHPPENFKDRVREFRATFFDNPIPTEKDSELCTYRDNHALVTYGDDNLKSCRLPPPENCEELWRDEIGIVMTDASKLGRMRLKTLDEVSFLKRSFTQLEGVDGYVAKLDLKSLARMMIMKRDTTLGDSDHAAVVASEFLREAVYHGRSFYDEYAAMIRRVAAEIGVLSNPYLVIKTFDDRLAEINAGTFQTWTLREPVSRGELFTDGDGIHQLVFQMKMSDVQFVNGADSVPQVQPSDNVLVHDTGSIDTSGGGVIVNSNNPNFFQQMPKNDLNDFLLRAVRIGSYSLTQANGTLSSLFSFKPWELFQANSAVAEKLARFSYIRGTIQIILVPTFPSMCYGALAVTALPDGETGVGVAPTLYIQNCLQTDYSGIIDFRESNKLVFQLPYIGDTDVKKKGGAGSDGINDTWQIFGTILSPLRSAMPGGVTEGTIQVYANLMDDYELTVPHFQGRKLLANAALKTHAPEIHAMIGEGKGSAMAGKIADTASMLSKVPVIGGIAEGVSLAARAAQGVLSFFGFTVENVPRNPTPFVARPFSATSCANGEEYSMPASLSLSPFISRSGADAGFSSEDCLANAALFGRWTLIASVPWSPTDDTFIDLVNIPICPGFSMNASTETVIAFHPTVPGFIGLPFEYWRGTMKYKLVIPVSMMHKGVLQVVWVPNDSSLSSVDVTNLTLNTMFDVSEGGSREIEFGFSRDQPLLHNRYFTDHSTIQPIGDCNGYFALRVINPLVSPNSTASVMISIFAAAGPDMEFHQPRDTLFMDEIGIGTLEAPFQSNIELQGMDGQQGDGTIAESVVVVPISKPYPTAEMLTGERFSSVRELLQKPSKLNAVSYLGLATFPSPIWTPGSTVNVGYGTITVWTWAGHYQSMFHGLAASERFKFLPDLVNNNLCYVGAARIYQLLPTYPDVTPCMAPISSTMGGGHEVVVPYYHNKKFFNPRVTASDITPGRKTAIRVQWTSGNRAMRIWHSYGPDIRATCFRQLPKVSYKATTVGFTSW